MPDKTDTNFLRFTKNFILYSALRNSLTSVKQSEQPNSIWIELRFYMGQSDYLYFLLSYSTASYREV